MLERQPNGSGWQVTLRSQGALRYVPAAFLCAWLCSWAVGEHFALSVLGSALRSVLGPGFLAGWLPAMHGAPPSAGVLPLFFVFISVWLALWTLGGLGALSHVLTLLFGREVIRWDADALEVERYTLFPASASRIERSRITGFRMRRGTLVADTPAHATPLAQLGSPADRQELQQVLEAWRREFGPAPGIAAGESPVPDWIVDLDEAGVASIRPVPRTRHFVGAILTAIGMGFVGAAVAVGVHAHGGLGIAGALLVGGPGALCLFGGGWLLLVSESWRPRRGVLERRRAAFGRVWSHDLTPLGLELRAITDSDGDTRWELVVTGGGRERILVSSLVDPNQPASLGQWLAERTGVELVHKSNGSTLRRAG